MLCRHLRQRHPVKFISFKRQYPAILFPGQTDRDFSDEPMREDPVEYLIDSLNPWTWKHAGDAILDYGAEMIVMPWWVAFWGPCFGSILSRIGKRADLEKVFVCHNVIEHEAKGWKRRVTRNVLARANRFLVHSAEEKERLCDLLGPGARIDVVHLPSFAEVSERRWKAEEAKAQLGVDRPMLLFFGFVREYKGLHDLIDALPVILQVRDVLLYLVGEFWEDQAAYTGHIARLGLQENVVVVNRYVPNEEIGLYFAAADLVVQPYRSVSGSGISQVAFGFDRPVIGTRVGSLAEVIRNGVDGRLVEPGNPAALAKTIIECLEPETLQGLKAEACNAKHRFSWDSVVDAVVG
jgi:glycosyltransferase involved in cell wall biosynthesis